jgi:secreted PhoX family phosphatase
MGRFAHEAAVADNASGIVYMTEDAGNNSGFYRFLPNDPTNLLAGGVLQMLKVRRVTWRNAMPNLLTGGVSQILKVHRVTNYNTIINQTIGAELPVEWVTIDNPNPATLTFSTSCFAQGYAKGGTRFNRLEGIFRGDDGTIFFASTSGGNRRFGQLWQYIPSVTGDATLVLVYESPAGSVLDSPDNICVTPRSGVLFCEDDVSNDNDTHPLAPGLTNINRLVSLSRAGEPFEFAVNVFSESEFAGACFSPNGEILFVNIQGYNNVGSGMTCAIWGSWHYGPL